MIKIEYKVSKDKLNAITTYDYYSLTFLSEQSFVPVSFKTDKEEVVFNFQSQNYMDSNRLSTSSSLDKILFLMSVSKLEKYYQDFEFSLDPSNIMIDYQMNAYILFRDINIKPYKSFEYMFQCLILSLLTSKNYEFYFNDQFISKINDEQFACIADMDYKQLCSFLQEQHKYEIDRLSKSKMILHKSFKHWLRFTVLLICAFIVTIGFIIYQNKVVFPSIHKSLMSVSAYLSSDYVGVIDVLESVKTRSMNLDESFVLATSYVKTSGLSKEAQNQVLPKITNKDNIEYNLFWIALGRKEFEDAYAIAKKYEDSRLLYFAYSTEYNSIDTNSELISEDSKNRKAELKNMIDKYIDGLKEETR